MAIISPLKKIFNWQLASEKIDTYQYKEVNISSADLINPPVTPALVTGAQLLPLIGNNQYYEWKLNVEFTPGATAYDPITDQIEIYSTWAYYTPLVLSDIPSQKKIVWQLDSRSGWQDSANNNGIYGDPVDDLVNAFAPYLVMNWSPGVFVGGDGTMKAKLWYKINKFG